MMKIGDTIQRKDMALQVRIIGESKKWPDMWEVKSLYSQGRKKKGVCLLSKDDDRWFVVEE